MRDSGNELPVYLAAAAPPNSIGFNLCGQADKLLPSLRTGLLHTGQLYKDSLLTIVV